MVGGAIKAVSPMGTKVKITKLPKSVASIRGQTRKCQSRDKERRALRVNLVKLTDETKKSKEV